VQGSRLTHLFAIPLAKRDPSYTLLSEVAKTGAFIPEQTIHQLNNEPTLQTSGMLRMKFAENSNTALEL
jgi:hypothetical protein